jgi:hypothetical protein
MTSRCSVPTCLSVLAVLVSVNHAGAANPDAYTPGFNGVTAAQVSATPTRIDLPTEVLANVRGASLTVEAVVLKDGTVAHVRITDCSAKGFGLESRVVEAVSGWKFSPGTWLGKPVDTVKRLTLALGDTPQAPAPAAVPVTEYVDPHAPGFWLASTPSSSSRGVGTASLPPGFVGESGVSKPAIGVGERARGTIYTRSGSASVTRVVALPQAKR